MLTNPAKPITIYDVAENVGKSYPLAVTPVNILVGFRVSGMWPVNPNIFTDDEYLSSNTCSEEFCGPSTSNSISCVISEQVRHFPKAKSRSKSNRGGQKQERCRILTDTPEKEEIKKQHAIKIAKKRKLVKISEWEIEANSSEELSNIEDSHSTDVRNAIEKGDFCLTRIEGKKTEHFYVVEEVDVKEHYSVKFLKKIARSNVKYDKEETYEIDSRNIVFKLPKPQSVGVSEQ
ncbi:casein kinase I isoform alpha [Trichonephila clavipes]|nr:casein kinase I isoform alpha [Trichonephila clavipes]